MKTKNEKYVPSKKSLESMLKIFEEARDHYYDSALYSNIQGKDDKR